MSYYATYALLEAYTLKSLRARDIFRAAEQEDVEIALNQADEIIDGLAFVGTPLTPAHAFPRTEYQTVPENISKAAIEIALALLDGVDTELEYEATRHTSEGMETAQVTYSQRSEPMHVLLGIPSRRAYTLMLPYLQQSGEIELCRV